LKATVKVKKLVLIGENNNLTLSSVWLTELLDTCVAGPVEDDEQFWWGSGDAQMSERILLNDALVWGE
jgi:hypothetical protein